MREDALAALEASSRLGIERVEVFCKRGRTRRFRCELGLDSVHTAVEEGWAIRAGDDRSSVFRTGSGSPVVDAALAARPAGRLLLPPQAAGAEWAEPLSVSHPLLSEAEGRQILDDVQAGLEAEVPASRLGDAVLDDGESESFIASSQGVRAGHRSRAAVTRWEAWGPPPALDRAVVTGCAASGRELGLPSLLARLVDLLRIKMDGSATVATGAAMVLAPEVAARVVGAVAGAFIGTDLGAAAERLGGAHPGSAVVNLVDDGRLIDGLVAAPVDGEGVPTGRRPLVRAGVVVDALQAWDAAPGGPGCRRRPGWRDRPATGASHLFLEPDPEIGPLQLLEDVRSGYYLVGSDEGVVAKGDRLSLRVYGFEVAAGRPVAPVFGRLVWDPLTTLKTIAAVGRDLRFVPMGAMIGSPTLLATGWDLC